ncbi:MAG: carboxypeptidase-like regulatory domain-containing protein [Methanolinea sp.]|jgi:hypothetical protein|nr:carboxypeptidase-like regulatory domain-containing protein [Methanolinea sp.]
MQRIETCFVFALLSMLLFTGPALGVTVLVNVYEKEGNITPLSGASLYANGALVGKSDSGGNIEFSHPGTDFISISVEKLGYSPWSGDIGVNTTTLLVEMSKKKVPLLVQVYDTDTLANVPGASVCIRDGGSRNTSQTDANGTSSFIVTGDSVYILEISATNYRTFSDQVEVGLDQKTVQAMLFRDDRFSVQVKDEETGNPLAGASVSVDGTDRGVTDQKGVVTLALPREKVYMVQVRMEGYEDYHERQIVEKDQALITISIRKSPYSVFVSVYNEERNPVEGAVVLVDGLPQGSTNRYGRLQLANLTLGKYQLEVRHPGFMTRQQQLQVTIQGDDVPVDLEYLGVNVSITTLEDGSIPVPGVTVFINGKEEGTTRDDGTLFSRMRLDTPYVISAEKEGYNPAKVEKVFSSQNETAPLIIPMERSINWLMVGVVLAVVVAACLAAVILLKRRGPGKMHGHRGGL